MNRIGTLYQLERHPRAGAGAVVRGERYRFTVLTPYLLRLEYSAGGYFEDRATQTVLNRDFPEAEYRVVESGAKQEIITEGLKLTYDKKEFTANGLQIRINGNYSAYSAVWHYGEEARDLNGTARTLDFADGAIPLGHGVLSVDGWALLDDSRSFVLAEDGWVEPRPDGEAVDLYFFGYGRDYLRCLRDYYRLTGRTPLLPRFALGNWWSRYYRYTEAEYKELMERFEREGIPFTVAVIDMDWHLTDIDPKYGSGWTGYTWNRELFPDPEAFLEWLHQKGLRVTLNLHPADGIRAFEACYLELAEALGQEAAHGDPVPFNIADPEFLKAYFRCVLHPLEEMGVDFWWLDWQQGTHSEVPGLDPLWMLNHFHFLDNGRKVVRPLTFSRYAGPGSHRYPIGFSGDSAITWASLDFQPYFTATASNIGYGWWSHDIGGHMKGVRDDELAVRWLQFGVFSPIMRLHSSCNPFSAKEPWRYNAQAEGVMKDYLRLRHRMIPYLYTMNRICHAEGLPLIRPMYYNHPRDREAYHVPNQYYFGSELISCPITKPMDPRVGVAKFAGWLPDGLWIDFFTGMLYNGGRSLDFYRPLELMPVLGKAGGIVPLSSESGNAADNPARLELRVFAGADGEFHLFEDDGVSLEENWVDTLFTFHWGKDAGLEIMPAQGALDRIPAARTYTVYFIGLGDGAEASVTVDGKPADFKARYEQETSALRVEVGETQVTSKIQIYLHRLHLADNRRLERCFDLLDRAQIAFDLKNDIYSILLKMREGRTEAFVLGELQTLELDPMLVGALCEILLA